MRPRKPKARRAYSTATSPQPALKRASPQPAQPVLRGASHHAPVDRITSAGAPHCPRSSAPSGGAPCPTKARSFHVIFKKSCRGAAASPPTGVAGGNPSAFHGPPWRKHTCRVRISALAGIALAGIALAGIALAGIALAGIALAGIALAGTPSRRRWRGTRGVHLPPALASTSRGQTPGRAPHSSAPGPGHLRSSAERD